MKMNTRMLLLILLLLSIATAQWIAPEPAPSTVDSSSDAPGTFKEIVEQPELSVEPEEPARPKEREPEEEPSPFELDPGAAMPGPIDPEDPFAIPLQERRKRKEQQMKQQGSNSNEGAPSGGHKRRDKHHGRRDRSKYANGKPRHGMSRTDDQDEDHGCMQWLQQNPEIFYLVGAGLIGLVVFGCLKSGNKTGRRTRVMRQAVPQMTQVNDYVYPVGQPVPVFGDSLESQISFHRMEIQRLRSQREPVRGYSINEVQ